MKIINLKLYTNKLEIEKEFYANTLGFQIIDDRPKHFTVTIGWSELTFEQSNDVHLYHYCFLIPSNKLSEAMVWLEERVEILEIDQGRKTQVFDSWNAESIYFFDKSGSLVEFIVRHDLNNESEADFGIDQVLCINEIGLPSTDVTVTNSFLEKQLKTKFWKGDRKRFGTNGTQEGLFLLPNYEVKDTWFPSTLKIQSEPFEATIENRNDKYFIEYKNEKIITKQQ